MVLTSEGACIPSRDGRRYMQRTAEMVKVTLRTPEARGATGQMMAALRDSDFRA
jgi:hypothetical protein